ncbi:MAG: heparan-alpha-glucosaminide N-acetyltransferase domain-containing protein [Promethearchaeota archaeon]
MAELKREKKQRYASLDFIRGVAMLGVLLFHVLNVAYDTGPVERMEAPVALLVIGVVLIYLGMFNGLFVLISGLVNLVTMNSQWERLSAKGRDPADISRQVLTTQLVRGAFTWLMGVVSEWLLNGLVLDLVRGKDLTWVDFAQYFYQVNILQTIGLCTMISSGLYVLLRRRGTSPADVVKVLAVLALVVLVLRPVAMWWIEQAWGGNYSFWHGLETRSPGANATFIILAPFFGRFTPLVPYLAISFVGTAMGVMLVQEGLTTGILKRWVVAGALICVAGLASTAVEGLEFDVSRHFGSFLGAFGGEVIATSSILYLIDFRGKTDEFARRTIFFRRIALVTLTLWCLQWVMYFPLLLFDAVTGWGALDKALNGYQLLLLLALITAFWYAVLKAWERADYKYSFEWLANKVIGKKRDEPSGRLRVKDILYASGGGEAGRTPEEEKN